MNMRLTKFFPSPESIDTSINSWVYEEPHQRYILQIILYKEGVLVLYEKASTPKEEWEVVEESLAQKPKRKSVKAKQ